MIRRTRLGHVVGSPLHDDCKQNEELQKACGCGTLVKMSDLEERHTGFTQIATILEDANPELIDGPYPMRGLYEGHVGTTIHRFQTQCLAKYTDAGGFYVISFMSAWVVWRSGFRICYVGELRNEDEWTSFDPFCEVVVDASSEQLLQFHDFWQSSNGPEFHRLDLLAREARQRALRMVYDDDFELVEEDVRFREEIEHYVLGAGNDNNL